MTILKDGRIKGSAHTSYFGSAEIAARYKYEGVGTTMSEKMVGNQLAKFRHTGEGKLKATSVYDLDKPLETDSQFTLDAVSNFPGPGAMMVSTQFNIHLTDIQILFLGKSFIKTFTLWRESH